MGTCTQPLYSKKNRAIYQVPQKINEQHWNERVEKLLRAHKSEKSERGTSHLIRESVGLFGARFLQKCTLFFNSIFRLWVTNLLADGLSILG